MTELHDLLDRATDRVEAPGLAAAALLAARRRRTARRGVLATVLAVAVVVGVAVTARLGDPVSVGPMPAPTTTPTTGRIPAGVSAPALVADRIQEVWDPRSAEAQPVVDLGVPRVMEFLEPGRVTRPVALLVDGAQVRLVSADGRVEGLVLPAGLGSGRTVSLSPDGRLLVAIGTGGFFWRDPGGGWQRVGSETVPQEAQLTWLPDSSAVLVRGWERGIRLELPSGESTEEPGLQELPYLDVADDGAVVGVTAHREVVQWRRGDETSRVSTGRLEGLVRPAVGDSVIAFARANRTTADPPAKDDRDGLLAVDRETFETRAYLPVPDDHYYVHAEELAPLAWLGDDTVAFTVLPEGAPKEYLMTWDVETGEISRVACWERGVDVVFATDLLG